MEPVYYVVFVGSGQEEKVEIQIRKLVDQRLWRTCFHPIRHMKKKIRGKWTHLYERLIPGYVFIETDPAMVISLYERLKILPAITKMLGKEQDNGEAAKVKFYPLAQKEELWLRRMSGLPLEDDADRRNKNPLIDLSQISFGPNDQVQIIAGPLREMKGQIKKIHLHKRMAEVEVDFMGRKTIVHLGIELVEKDTGMK